MRTEGTAGPRARRRQNVASLENCKQFSVAGDIPEQEDIQAEAGKKGKGGPSRDLLCQVEGDGD